MPQINPYDLPRRPSVTESRSFTQPGLPGVSLELTLTGTDETAFLSMIDEQAGRLIDKFTGPTAAPLPALRDGTPVAASKDICFIAARLMTMQVSGPEDDPATFKPYSFVHWVGFAKTMPKAFVDAGTWANSLLHKTDVEDDDDGMAEEAAEQENPPPSEEGLSSEPA